MQLLNYEHKVFLFPLSDWRILDINGLIELSYFEKFKNYQYAKKLLQRLRAKNLVNVYHNPWSKKNYYYLTSLSEKVISPDFSSKLMDETLYHDSMVSSLGVELLKIKPFIESIELEHKIKSQKTRTQFDQLFPDARMKGDFNGQSFLVAIEVEIHQKEKSRIIAKANNYQKSTLYDYIFYFFPEEKLMKNYNKILKEGLDENYNQKIFLFTAPQLFNGKNSLCEGSGLVKNQQKTILELFGVVP
jgi:hypothetical protein